MVVLVRVRGWRKKGRCRSRGKALGDAATDLAARRQRNIDAGGQVGRADGHVSFRPKIVGGGAWLKAQLEATGG